MVVERDKDLNFKQIYFKICTYDLRLNNRWSKTYNIQMKQFDDETGKIKCIHDKKNQARTKYRKKHNTEKQILFLYN